MKKPQVVSAQNPDWSREKKRPLAWDPPRALLASIRSYQKTTRSKGAFAFVMGKIAVIRHRFFSIITGAEIHLKCKIGGGLLIPHPNGIVIHPDVEFGVNCLIFQQVTIGANSIGVPTIGGHVDIGAGAKIIGPIKIGDHARISANAVVVDHVPAGALVVAPVGKVITSTCSET